MDCHFLCIAEKFPQEQAFSGPVSYLPVLPFALKAIIPHPTISYPHPQEQAHSHFLTAFAKSTKASFRLKRASSITPITQVTSAFLPACRDSFFRTEFHSTYQHPHRTKNAPTTARTSRPPSRPTSRQSSAPSTARSNRSWPVRWKSHCR